MADVSTSTTTTTTTLLPCCVNYYSSCSTLIVGCYLYTDSGLTTPVPDGYYSAGTNCITVSGELGEITAIESCVPPPPPSTTTTSTTTTTTTAGGAFVVYVSSVESNCSLFCNNNYLINVQTTADAVYNGLAPSDTIYGLGGNSGWVAVSNISTDTDTGPFYMYEVDSSGTVLSVAICNGNTCEIQ